MKINVIRYLILPWGLFFILAITGIVFVGVNFPTRAQDQQLFYGVIGLAVLVCLFANMRTLNKAGIWIAHSLPVSLKYNSRPWFMMAVKAAAVALAIYLMGQISWVPLVWQAFVIPIIFSAALFVGVWGLMGPILMWSSRISFSRVVAFLVSLPVFALVPITAVFLGKNIVSAYLASRPELQVAAASQQKVPAPEEEKPVVKSEEVEPKDKKAEEFKVLATAGKPCLEQSKDIQANLVSNGPEDVVYWAVRSVKCTDMSSVVALPKLAKVMMDHPNSRVRAAAIRAMPRFGADNVQRIAYLLVKRINEKESQEVIEAAASVLSRIGEEERKFATNRLKSLLDSDVSAMAAKVLVENMKRDDLVSEYVAANMEAAGDGRVRAVSMICTLPKASRSIAEPYINQVVSLIKTGSKDDPAMVALDCLGKPGFQAIRQEVLQPQQLQRPVAARALAEMNVRGAPEALETAQTCVRDEDEQVRKWCSQSLGKIGTPALPKILDLLKSNDSELKEAGRNALNFFDDPEAKDELEQVRDDNSGWLANKKKLQIAEAVNTALIKIETETQTQGDSTAPAETEETVQK